VVPVTHHVEFFYKSRITEIFFQLITRHVKLTVMVLNPVAMLRLKAAVDGIIIYRLLTKREVKMAGYFCSFCFFVFLQSLYGQDTLYLHLARPGSQSQCEIRCILPAH